MQHVPCTDYVVIGQLLHKELEDNQKIHRSVIAANQRGRINIYFYNGTFILECDTNGDHNPNDYYFFTRSEEKEVFDTLAQMGSLIGTNDPEKIKEFMKNTLQFLRNF
ncbi:Hypothetical protein LUCI_1619 [Lucifera butyrica]|uniref:Uncharacterized protein n=1 Tax=Lucifera butyrica TaxID=1351585 RepID=A0A498RB86_9FIRM|nr:hypothetical protein [Lucifera butyrica]VBB06388.1 Hypothetical protein LUCI_1619 [Lucifera butyrica]